MLFVRGGKTSLNNDDRAYSSLKVTDKTRI